MTATLITLDPKSIILGMAVGWLCLLVLEGVCSWGRRRRGP